MVEQTGRVNIRGKEYKTVALRVEEFRRDHPLWSLTSELVNRDDKCVVVRSLVRDENDRLIATGFAEEYRESSQINKTSALENCETSAHGRALAALGYGGTEFASANEVQNAVHQQNTPTDDHTPEPKAAPTKTPAPKPPENQKAADAAVAKIKLGEAPDLATLEKWDEALPMKFPGNPSAVMDLRAVSNVRFVELLPDEAGNMDYAACAHWQTWAGSRGYDDMDVENMTAPIRMRIEELDGQEAGKPVT